PTPLELIGQIQCPVYGFFGDLDTNPSPADVDHFESELERHDIPCVFHRYPTVGHGFQNAARARNPEEVATGNAPWTTMLPFMTATDATASRIEARAAR